MVLKLLTKAMARSRPDWEFHVITHSSVAEECSSIAPNVTVHYDQNAERSSWRTRLWYEVGFSKLIRRVGPDVVFSQTNYLPIRQIGVPTVLLEQHAGHFSNEFDRLMCKGLTGIGRVAWRMKSRWVRSSIRRADAVTVQTAALAAKIVKITGIAEKRISVIPHGPGLVRRLTAVASPPEKGEPIRLGYVTNPGVQKNFDVLLTAARRLQDREILFKLILTLDPSTTENQLILKKADELGIRSDFVENHGALSQGEVRKVYESLHVFIFPSLCESFGFPMVEALAQGVPLITSDVDCNREVGGIGALFFPPHDGEILSRLIERFQDRDFFRERAIKSRERSKAFDWDSAASQTIRLIESQLNLER